ncbi:MAG: glycosyltransferase family 2 protein [Sporolactobacillus sp.]
MEPIISVIVPIYNVETYLPRAIESILAQTYPHLEILLIDDGSTDQSSCICENYAQKDDRISVYHKPNGGLSDARNFGMKKATGSYIGFVDSDDSIHPDMYRIMLNELVKNDGEIAEVDFTKVKESTDEALVQQSSDYTVESLDHQQAMIQTLLDYCGCYAWNKLYRRELWVHIQFPYGRIFEDVATIYKVVHRTSKLIRIHCSLYFYTQRPDSIVSSHANLHKEQQHLQSLNEILQFVDQKRHDLLPAASIHYFEASMNILYSLMKLGRHNSDVDKEIKTIEKQMENYISYSNDRVLFYSFYRQYIRSNNQLLKKRRKIMMKFFLYHLSRHVFYYALRVRENGYRLHHLT